MSKAFYPELDSLRFIAVALVIISHWVPQHVLNSLPNGTLGVDFFFVLSGFLITRNLILDKSKLSKEEISAGKVIKNFYLRRTLRIFPLYYFVLIGLFLLKSEIFSGGFSWFFFYVPNILVFKMQNWVESLSHFWSLAVEEQFYLFWPLIIIIIPLHRLNLTMLLTIVVSMLFKVGLFLFTNYSFTEVIALSCFDLFAVGGLLAMNLDKFACIWSKIPVWQKWIIYLGLILISSICFKWFSPLFNFFIGTISLLLILYVTIPKDGKAKKVLDLKLFKFLGKISYGLYVYHNFMPYFLRCLMGTEERYPIAPLSGLLPVFDQPYIFLMVSLSMLIVVATISWFVLERPFLMLKKYF